MAFLTELPAQFSRRNFTGAQAAEQVLRSHGVEDRGNLKPQKGGGCAGVAVSPCKQPIKARKDHGGGGVVLGVHKLKIF